MATNVTEANVRNTSGGGALAGTTRQGQTIIHKNGTLGGFAVGKMHGEGGIKAQVKGGQQIELQGNEVIITAPAVASNKKYEFNGKMKTSRQILSDINVDGGGVSFADGGDVPESIKCTGKKYTYGGKLMQDHEIVQGCGCKHSMAAAAVGGNISAKDIKKLTAEQNNYASGGRTHKPVGGNSGYVGYSMSVRAQQAYEDGKLNYSKLPTWAKRMVDADLVTTDEWHHTSSYGNETPFYNVGQFDKLTDDQKKETGIEDWESIETFKHVPKAAIKLFDAISKEELKKKNNIKSVRKQNVDHAQKALNDFNANFKSFSRTREYPKHSMVNQSEMDGKYGWFNSTYKYSLPEYYSGIDYETAENKKKAYELEEELSDAKSDPIYQIELSKRGFTKQGIATLKNIGIIISEIMPASFYNLIEKNSELIKQQLKQLSELPTPNAEFNPQFNKSSDSFLTDAELHTRQEYHNFISEQGEDFGSSYERKLAHESNDKKYYRIANERYNEAKQEFLNSNEVKLQQVKFDEDKKMAEEILGNIKSLFKEEEETDKPIEFAKGGTIKDKVSANVELLKGMKTHTELRQWAIANQMDNRSAFPKFKTALNEIGLDYDQIKTGIFAEKKEELINKINYSVTLYSDAKASAGKFGITNADGNVLWYGRFFDNEDAGEQSSAELEAAKKAVWLTSKIKEAIGEPAIELLLYVDAEWLTYQDHSGQKGYALTQLARKHNIDLHVHWISGKENPADEWTTANGYKKWSDNNLKTLAVVKEGKAGKDEADMPAEQPKPAPAKEKAVKVFGHFAEYDKSYGMQVYVEEHLSEQQVRRTLFFPKKLTIQKTDDFIIVPEWIFDKKIEETKEDVSTSQISTRVIDVLVNFERMWIDKTIMPSEEGIKEVESKSQSSIEDNQIEHKDNEENDNSKPKLKVGDSEHMDMSATNEGNGKQSDHENRQRETTNEQQETRNDSYNADKGRQLMFVWADNEAMLKKKFNVLSATITGEDGTLYLKFDNGSGSLDLMRGASPLNYTPSVYTQLKDIQQYLLDLADKYVYKLTPEQQKALFKLSLQPDSYVLLPKEYYDKHMKELEEKTIIYETATPEKFPNTEMRLTDNGKRFIKNYDYDVENQFTGLLAVPVQSTIQGMGAFKGTNFQYKNPFDLNKAIEELVDTLVPGTVTAEQKQFISYYSGYGGLQKYGATGKGLLYEYFTPTEICKRMWGLAYKFGFKGGRVLEPAVGIGEFVKYAPDQSQVTTFEINEYSHKIFKLLYPAAKANLASFETLFIKNNRSIKDKTSDLQKFSLVIGNPPYGSYEGLYAGIGEKSYTKAENWIDYFITRGLDLLDTNGLLIFIIGTEVAMGGTPWLDKDMTKCKAMIAEKADLLDAYRLPNGVFERTDVLSDIIVLRKK